MPEKKKIKVKVKKRKINIKRILIFILIITIPTLIFIFVKDLSIKNIYIIGNSILSDKEIIDTSGIENYPSFLKTSKKNIIKNLEKNDYIREVTIKKKFYNKIYIYVIENKILCTYFGNVILESGKEIENTYQITSVPILTSDITSIKEKFIQKFSLINNDVLLKISEISYVPNEVDNERFSLRMNDGNLVYITLNKITKVNKYNSIFSEMNDRKGIIYLDSGDYIELKDD